MNAATNVLSSIYLKKKVLNSGKVLGHHFDGRDVI